ncbi:hypothetical protein M0804_014123, partial [Polistes exclamans]
VSSKHIRSVPVPSTCCTGAQYSALQCTHCVTISCLSTKQLSSVRLFSRDYDTSRITESKSRRVPSRTFIFFYPIFFYDCNFGEYADTITTTTTTTTTT